MEKILFINHDRRPTLRNKNSLKAFIRKIFENERKKLESVVYVFCSDEYLLEINKAYLKHNYYTDVISFDLSESPKKTKAEIYISIDRVKENALKLGVSFNLELLRVIFHGALHFCKYNDTTKQMRIKMHKAENKYIKNYINK